MVPAATLRRKALEIATSQPVVVDVRINATANSRGEPIFSVRVVTARRVTERETLELTYDLYQGLSDFLEANEDFRRPLISFVTAREMASSR